MALDKLPLELIHLIAHSLSEQGDRYALILSCRRFYELLIHTLYSNVTLFKSIDKTSWYSFSHTIAHKPALAEAVKNLYIYAWEVSNGAKDFECDPNLISKLLDEIPQSDDERDEWEEDAKAGIADAWLGLMLPLLPNLQRIDIVLPFGSVYFNSILRKAALGDIQAFSKLEEAYISWHDTKNAVASSFLMPFFHFPSMRKLGGSKIAEYDPITESEFTGELAELPLIESSGITQIDFRGSNNTEAGMFHLIRSCKALKSFRLGYGGVMTSDDDFHPRALVRSLERHKTSLERLWVEIDCDMVTEMEDEPIPSLTEFSVLKHLHIRLPDLLDFHQHGEALPQNQLKDILPPSLNILYLSWCSRAHLKYLPRQLDEMIQSGRESQLMKLYIEGDGEIEHTDSLIEQLRDICRAAGIMFEFVSPQMRWEIRDVRLRTREEDYQSMWPSAFEFDIF